MTETLEGGWFREADGLWPGRALSLRVDKVLYEGKSKFQSIRVFESPGAGRVLTLDNIIQLTESDEFAYQEMLTHVPLFSHPDPKSVLVIGGGDGGIVREIVRHPAVERIVLCEIDEMVVEVSRKHLPFTACSLDDPRVEILYEDGAKLAAASAGQYDVIVVDSSDPIGPAEVLFREPFYRDLCKALRPGGILTTQAECIWLHKDIILRLCGVAKGLFPSVAYGLISVPTYPGGMIGLLAASLGPEVRVPLRQPDPALQNALRYYTPEIHRACFHLPAFARRWFE